MTIPDSKRQRTLSHSSNEGTHLVIEKKARVFSFLLFTYKHNNIIEMTSRAASDIDMTDVNQEEEETDNPGQDLEKGLISPPDSPEVLKYPKTSPRKSFKLIHFLIIDYPKIRRGKDFSDWRWWFRL